MFKIKELCDIKGGKRVPQGIQLLDTPTPYPYIRVSDFKNGSIDTSKMKYITETVFTEIRNYTISKDDVYISIAGSIGIVGRIPQMLDNANLTENAAKLVIKSPVNLDADFLMYVLNMPSIQSQFNEHTHAVGVPKLALFRIGEIKIPVPSKDEQEKIAQQIAEYETQIAACEQKIQSLPAQKQAILAKYLQ